MQFVASLSSHQESRLLENPTACPLCDGAVVLLAARVHDAPSRVTKHTLACTQCRRQFDLVLTASAATPAQSKCWRCGTDFQTGDEYEVAEQYGLLQHVDCADPKRVAARSRVVQHPDMVALSSELVELDHKSADAMARYDYEEVVAWRKRRDAVKQQMASREKELLATMSPESV